MRGPVAGSRVRRLRRLIPEGRPNSDASDVRVRPRVVVLASLWIGLITGPSEVALVLALKPLRDPTPGLFHMNRHLLWMIPLFHLLMFGGVGCLLGWLARFRPRFSTRRAAWMLLFVGVLSVTLAVRAIHPIACAILAAGLAFRLAGPAESVLFGSSRVVALSFPWLIALGGVLLGLTIGREALSEHQGRSGSPRAAAGSPNVVLIVMDTVSADHLSLYGYQRATTPNLDRIARNGLRFECARSTAPWTLPSHASMFTGRWPHELSAGFEGPLDSSMPTLAEFLRDRGYVTGGFIANTLYCSAETGLNRGFVHYEDHDITAASFIHSAAMGHRVLEKAGPPAARLLENSMRTVASAVGRETTPPLPDRPRKPYKDASRVTRDALDWLSAHEGRPYFLFLNLFDAHTPYLLPDGFDRHFGRSPRDRADYSLLNAFWGADKRKLDPRAIELARDAYDDCIAYMDEQLGRFVDELDRRGQLRNTLIIITADHGEGFGGHELFGHAGSLYRDEVHVPLIVVPPSGVAGGQSIAEPVSLRNIPITVADALGQAGSAPFPGISLTRDRDRGGDHPAAELEDPVLSEVLSPATNNANQGRSPVFRGSMSSLVSKGKVYIRNGDGREELYDLMSDPGETRNLAGSVEVRQLLPEMRARLSHAIDGSGPVRR